MNIEYQKKEYGYYLPIWQKCNDAYTGEKAIKDGGQKYLPALSGQMRFKTVDGESQNYTVQTDEDYSAYKKRAVYYNYVKKMTDSLNEQLVRKQVKVNVPPKMDSIIEHFSSDKKSFLTAVKESNKDILLNYRSVCVLDAPDLKGEKVLTIADAEAQNLRIYAVYYNAEDVINWRYDTINNLPVLTLVVLKETIEDYSKDDFEPEEIVQYRVLDLLDGVYRVRIFRETEIDGDKKNAPKKVFQEDENLTTYPEFGGNKLNEIPCYFLTPKGISYSLEMPIVNDLVDLNLAHYRNSADFENALNITGSPTPVIKDAMFDFDEGEVSLGSSRALSLGKDGDAYFMEYRGQGLNALRDAMSKKIEALSVIGGRLLQADTKGAENAEVVEVQHSSERGQLASFARSIGEAYTTILKKIASWMNISGDINVEFNTDYSSTILDPQLFSNLTVALTTSSISPSTYFYNLKKGEMIEDGKTFEQEQEEIRESKIELMTLADGFETPPGVDNEGKVKIDNRAKTEETEKEE